MLGRRADRRQSRGDVKTRNVSGRCQKTTTSSGPIALPSRRLSVVPDRQHKPKVLYWSYRLSPCSLSLDGTTVGYRKEPRKHRGFCCVVAPTVRPRGERSEARRVG